MANEEYKSASRRFTWKVENFTKLTDHKYCSDIFTVDGCKWQILIYPKGSGEGYFSVYLKVADSETLPLGWSREVNFSLTLLNQNSGAHCTRYGGRCNFNQLASVLGFASFKHLNELCDLTKGYLVNDTVIVEAEVIVYEVTPPVGSHPSPPPFRSQRAAIQAKEFDCFMYDLKGFIQSSTKRQTSSPDSRPPSLEEVEKAKSLLKECLLDFFQLSMKEKFLAALMTLSCAESGLSSEQERSVQSFLENFDDFFSDFLTCEDDEFKFELHSLGIEQQFCAMKSKHDSIVFYKKLLDDLSENEEDLERKLQEVKSKKQKLMSDCKVMMTKTEEAKVKYNAHEKKLAEAEEKRSRAEERKARITAAWSNLKAHFI